MCVPDSKSIMFLLAYCGVVDSEQVMPAPPSNTVDATLSPTVSRRQRVSFMFRFPLGHSAGRRASQGVGKAGQVPRAPEQASSSDGSVTVTSGHSGAGASSGPGASDVARATPRLHVPGRTFGELGQGPWWQQHDRRGSAVEAELVASLALAEPVASRNMTYRI